MLSKCILIVLIVVFSTKNCLCAGQNFDSHTYFRSGELSKLFNIQDQVCKYSPNAPDPTKYDPWFCVEPKLCADHQYTRIPVKTTQDCAIYDEKEVPQSECCFIGNLRYLPYPDTSNITFPTVIALEQYWGLNYPTKETFVDYSKRLVSELIYEDVRSSLINNSVCGLLPVIKDSTLDVNYVPYICWHMDCTFSLHSKFKTAHTFKGQNAKEPDEFKNGAQFCSHEFPFNTYCCHPAVAADVQKSADFSVYNWRTKALNPRQDFAFGFRSSFQCEQYSRLTCEGDKDRCSQRILDKSIPLPGEFPYQALIGIQSPMTRLFHCNGALVSKYFILSAAECITYKGIIKREYGEGPATASVALLGEYDTHQVGEFGQRETITFLSEVYIEPYKFTKPNLALFRMWRAVNFHYWLRPACINWQSTLKPPEKPRVLKNVTFTGYGVDYTGGRWNGTIKRNTMYAAQLENFCKDVVKEEEAETFCAIRYPAKRPEPWGPCEFDLGGPASTLRREESPYCTFKLVGVAMTGRKDCNLNDGITFKDVGSVLPWIEEVVWGLDMNLFDFDLSTPPCESQNGREPRFIDMIHVKDL